MKKHFSLPVAIACVGVIFAIFAFVMMFMDQLGTKALPNDIFYSYDKVFFSDWGSPVGFIAYLATLILAILTCVLVCPHFIKQKNVRLAVVAFLSTLIIVSGVLILLQAIIINEKNAIVVLNTKSYLLNTYLSIYAILGGSASIASGLFLCCSGFLSKK